MLLESEENFEIRCEKSELDMIENRVMKNVQDNIKSMLLRYVQFSTYGILELDMPIPKSTFIALRNNNNY